MPPKYHYSRRINAKNYSTFPYCRTLFTPPVEKKKITKLSQKSSSPIVEFDSYLKN